MADPVVVGQDGRLLSRVDAILSEPDNLPFGVVLIQDPNCFTVMMRLTGVQYFRSELYKYVNF